MARQCTRDVAHFMVASALSSTSGSWSFRRRGSNGRLALLVMATSVCAVAASRPQDVQEPSSLLQTEDSSDYIGLGGYMNLPPQVSDAIYQVPGAASPMNLPMFTPLAQQEQSFLQNGASTFYGGGLGQESSEHEGLDTYMAHMDKIHRTDSINSALDTLREELGEAGRTGKLIDFEDQADQHVSKVHAGVDDWSRVTKETLKAAPKMAQAAKAAAEELFKGHERFAEEVSEHGKDAIDMLG